jgi:flagellar assembly factor FliW
MRVETSRFGAIEVDDREILTFTHPIIGFQEFRRFVLKRGASAVDVSWLQSMDSGELAFMLMDPRAVVPAYAVALGAGELAELAVQSVSELEIYTLVVAEAGTTRIRTNLKAPILVNPRQRLAKQTILDRSDYPVRFELGGAKAVARSREEV